MTCLKEIYSFIRKLDFVSPEVKLRTYGESRFKTLLGGIISLIMIIAVIFLTAYFLKIMFNRELIWVTYNELLNSNPFFNLTKYPIYFSLVDNAGNMIKDIDNLIEIKTELISNSFYKKNSTFILNSDFIQMKNCDFDKKFWCFSDEVDLILSKNSQNFTKLIININKKNNSLINSNFLDGAFINLNFIEYQIDNLNTSAGQLYLHNERMQISTNLYKNFLFTIREVRHNTDVGYVFFEHVENVYHAIEPMRESVYFKQSNENLASIEFRVSDRLDYYKRIYFKFQDVLADVGGIIESAIFFCLVIESYLAQKVTYCSLGNDLISFDSTNPRKLTILKLNSKQSFYEKEKRNNNSSFQINNYLEEERKSYDIQYMDNNTKVILNNEEPNIQNVDKK